MQGSTPRGGFALRSQHNPASTSAPLVLCSGRSSAACGLLAAAGRAAGMGDGAALQSSSRQAEFCDAWHAIVPETLVHPTASKQGKFLVRDALPAAPAVPQGALATGWEKQWQQDQRHEAS